MDSYLGALDRDISFHENALEYEASIPTNPAEYEDRSWAELVADMELEAEWAISDFAPALPKKTGIE